MNDEAKTFSTLAAEFALRGHALIKAKDDDTQGRFYAAYAGWLKPLQSLDEARALLNKIQGTKND